MHFSKDDPPLNALGRAQSERLNDAFAAMPIEIAFASPMRRCIETLAIAAPGVAWNACDALREIDFGAWDGHTLEWIETHDSHAIRRRRRDPLHFRPPGGESFLDLSHRLLPFVDTMRARAAGTSLVVAHRVTLGVLERLLRELPVDSREVVPLEPGEFHILP